MPGSTTEAGRDSWCRLCVFTVDSYLSVLLGKYSIQFCKLCCPSRSVFEEAQPQFPGRHRPEAQSQHPRLQGDGEALDVGGHGV